MKAIKVILIVVVSLLVNSQLFAQQSDAEIVNDFKHKIETIKAQLNGAYSTSETDSLVNRVLVLRDNYNAHSDIIDYALFPGRFDQQIDNLENDIYLRHQQLLMIEHQNEQIETLTSQLNRYKDEFKLLTQKADSLRFQISESQQSESYLSGLVSDYRKSLETRDKLIYNMIDTLLITYQGVNTTSMESPSEGQKGTIEKENVLTTILQIVEKNRDYINSGNPHLNTVDYLRMYALQVKTRNVWESIGDQLISTYSPKQKQQWQNEINTALNDWNAIVSMKMWASIDKYFEFNNISLEAFDNNYSFFVALDSYILNKTDSVGRIVVNNQSFEQFKKFDQLWNSDVKSNWSPYIIDSGILSVSQINAIDQKLGQWESTARPVHPMILGLFTLTFVALIGFTFALFKNKTT